MSGAEMFDVLIDDDNGPGLELEGELSRVLKARWLVPAATSRPYVYVNFVTSRDGRVSFAVPGHAGGGEVSRFKAQDRWLMALCRARSDAVLVGDGTLRAEPDHLWTPDFIWPEGPGPFAELRSAENRAEVATTVVLSLLGDLPPDAALFHSPGPVVVLT